MSATESPPPLEDPTVRYTAPRRNTPPMRRALRAFSTVLIVAGLLLLADAGITLAWQEPVSALMARIEQDQLAGELEEIEAAPVTPVQRRALAALPSQRRRVAFLAREARSSAEEGQPIGRIDIPRIGADFVVVEGTDSATLRKGPGHYPDTTFPGLRGTVAVAGHRTTYGAPFRKVDDLRRGDPIVVTLPYGRFTYGVQETKIVPPSALWVTRDVGYDRLVLSACHPMYSAAERIIVFARLRRMEPLGAAAHVRDSRNERARRIRG
jgi:sortase A